MLENKSLYLKSSIFGVSLGFGVGALLGAATGAMSSSWTGIQFGAIAGGLLGALTGALTGMVTVRIAGRTGGVSTGAYTGMLFGAVLGGVLGIFIPDSFRVSVAAFHVLVLEVLTQGRFETAVLLSFLLSVVATMVGAWVSGRNFKPRDLSKTA
jgi:MFS family permease